MSWHPICSQAHMRSGEQAPVILVIFVITQVLDGVLTYIGVKRLGVGVEMNMLLASAITAFGTAPAIVSAKTMSLICGGFLYVNAQHRPLAAAAGFHIGFAVIPWLVVVTVFM